MKTSFLAFAICCGFLTACSTPTQPQAADPNMLPSGTLQPVEGSGASQGSYSLPSDIKPTAMPDTMK
ncbi:TPA: hypothetical protein ACK3JR_001218 [Mannheimia haemolytica]